MLCAELVISSLHEVCLFWISFCQPSVGLHHYFWLSHPTTGLVLAMPRSVHTVCPILFKPMMMEALLLSSLKVFVLSAILVKNKAVHTWNTLSHSANSQELLTKILSRPLHPLFSPSHFSLLVSFWSFSPECFRCALRRRLTPQCPFWAQHWKGNFSVCSPAFSFQEECDLSLHFQF